MMDRFMGVLTLKSPVYKQIAEDKSATMTAGIIVVVMALLAGGIGAALLGVTGTGVAGSPQPTALGFAVRTIVSAIISWLVGSWVIGFVAKMLGGKTDTGEMLRVFGFTQIFQILAIVPVCGWIAGPVLSIFATVIGIREAAEFSTGKAILTGVIAFVALMIVYGIVQSVLGGIA